MIVEVYIQGKRLDLYEDESINVTQVSKDIQDISKVFADFSQSFNVPASARNNEIFKHYYNANIDGGYDARIRKDANLVVGGLDFKRGKMRLDSVEVMNNEPTSYKITFFGSVIQIKDLIGEDKLVDLEWLSNFNHAYNGAQVKTGLTSGIDFTVDGVDYDAAVIYPLISYTRRFIYNSSNSAHTNTDEIVNIAHHSAHSGNEHGVDYRDLKPAIKLSVIIKAIQEQYGFNFVSSFFDSNTFNKIYMNLNNKTEAISRNRGDIESGSVTIPTFPNSPYEPYLEYTVDIDPDDNTVEYKVLLYINDVKIYEDLNFRTGDVTISRDYFVPTNATGQSYTYRAEIISNDVFEFDGTSDIDFVFFFGLDESVQNLHTGTFTAETISSTLDILFNVPDLKVFDFLTGLFKTFNLVAYAENDEIIIKDLQSYYSQGRIFDVTEFIETKKEVIKRGEFFKEINFKFEESKQILSDEFRQSNNQGYGDLDFKLADENGNPLQDVDGETLDIKSIFENPIYERLTDVNTGDLTPIQYCLYTDREIKPIVGKPFIFFVISPNISSDSIGFIDENGETEIDTTVLMPSHAEFLTNSFNLNFGLEVNEYTYGIMQNTIYQRYWSDYIGDMFSIKRRNYEVEGILPPNLLNNLRLSDRLIIKGTRYIINKITSNLVDRRDQLELINDIYKAPLVSDVLNTSFFRQTRQVFDKGGHAYSFTYIGLSGKAINLVDLGDGTSHVKLDKNTTESDVFEIKYNLSVNSTGNELRAGIQVVDDINNPIHLVIQQA
jgi:hypothetical protein